MAASQLLDVDMASNNHFYCTRHGAFGRLCRHCRGCAGLRTRPHLPNAKTSVNLLTERVDRCLKPPHEHRPRLGSVGAGRKHLPLRQPFTYSSSSSSSSLSSQSSFILLKYRPLRVLFDIDVALFRKDGSVSRCVRPRFTFIPRCCCRCCLSFFAAGSGDCDYDDSVDVDNSRPNVSSRATCTMAGRPGGFTAANSCAQHRCYHAHVYLLGRRC